MDEPSMDKVRRLLPQFPEVGETIRAMYAEAKQRLDAAQAELDEADAVHSWLSELHDVVIRAETGDDGKFPLRSVS